MCDLRDTGRMLLQALSYAHHKLTEGVEDVWEVATTTFIGGILCPLQPSTHQSLPFAWVFASLGDCKVYHYSTKTGKADDLTPMNAV